LRIIYAWLLSWNAALVYAVLLLLWNGGFDMSKSQAEKIYLNHLRVAGLPEPEQEFMFARAIKRRWRSDFAYPSMMLLIEIEGGKWVGRIYQSRHTHPEGYMKDCQKYNAAALLGYRVLRFTIEMIESGEALATTEKALRRELNLNLIKEADNAKD
jgi:very-short-patch-repair endonuclease